MKNFLIVIFGMLVTYFLGPFYIAAIMAWAWLPIVFDLNNCFGGAGLGLVLGSIISVATTIVAIIVEDKLESY